MVYRTSPIFVDTGALIALEDVNDKNRIQRMRQGGILEIIHVSKEIEEESWQVFEEFNKDKMWSFTDCTSKVVMDSLRIKKVFAFDHHFDQMGLVRAP